MLIRGQFPDMPKPNHIHCARKISVETANAVRVRNPIHILYASVTQTGEEGRVKTRYIERKGE